MIIGFNARGIGFRPHRFYNAAWNCPDERTRQLVDLMPKMMLSRGLPACRSIGVRRPFGSSYMVHSIDTLAQLPILLAAPRAIVLVSVAWSPWPTKSRELLSELEATHHDSSVQFFDLWPERDDDLNRWYEALCVEASSRFELHGHGYGPFWWLANATILDCVARPCELSLERLQQRSVELFPSA